MHICPLATLFPTLYFTSPWLFCNYQLVLLNPITIFTTSSSNHQNVLCIYDSVSILLEFSFCLFIIYFRRFYLFIYFQTEGKGGRKRVREASMCGCLSCAPHREPGPKPRHWTSDSLVQGWHSIHWATAARAILFFRCNCWLICIYCHFIVYIFDHLLLKEDPLVFDIMPVWWWWTPLPFSCLGSSLSALLF